MFLHMSLTMSIKLDFNQWEGSNFSIHFGMSILISLTGNSLSTFVNKSFMSFSFILATSIIWTGTPYLISNSCFKSKVSSALGSNELSTIIKGLSIDFNSATTLSSASK